MSAPATSYVIEGREFRLPCEVRRATSGAASWLVPARAAQALLPEAFEVAQLLPGKAVLSIALIDYQDNDLGDYNEVSIALFVRPRGERPALGMLGNWIDMIRGRLGVHILHLPVDQSFTCEAGRTIWGYPKTVQQIDLQYSESRLSGRLVYDGQEALRLELPRGGTRSLPDGQMLTYSLIQGVPHVVRATQSVEGFGMRFSGAELTLGRGRIADELRMLGLPKRPLMCVWLEHMRASFGPAEKL